MTHGGLQDGNGPLNVGSLIGRGGEGEVFALANRPGRALKLYFKPDAVREAKIEAMVQANIGDACPSATFPEGVARKKDGMFVGFTMRLVTDHKPIHELYATGARKKHFPNVDYRFLVRTAANVARAIARVHAAGAVVGDINHSGIMVSPRATVTLIDADSFAFGNAHRCRVGVPEYTPPELQGKRLDDLVRTEQHDAFGLAVIVFQLLCLGRHPFAGVPAGRDVEISTAIAQTRFAYSRIRNTRLSPPPGALTLADLPLGIRVASERAFSIGFGSRPTPAEWVQELDQLADGLEACEQNGRHHVPAGTIDCPWCRIDAERRSQVFGIVPIDRPKVLEGQPDVDRLVQVIRARVSKIANAEFGVVRTREILPSVEAVAAKSDKPDARREVLVAIMEAQRESAFSTRYLQAQRDLAKALKNWRARVDVRQFVGFAVAVDRKLSPFEKLVDAKRQALAKHAANCRSVLLKEALQKHPVATARIPGIGSARRTILRANGIYTAAQIQKDKLDSIPGMGGAAVAALLIWRDCIAANILRSGVLMQEDRPDFSRAADEIKGKFEQFAASITTDLLKILAVSSQAASTIEARNRDVLEVVQGARYERDCALADLRYLELPLPNKSMTTKRAKTNSNPAPVKAQVKRGGAKTCPACNATMVKRWPRSGQSPNTPFLGCSRYPICNGTRPLRGRKP